MKGASGYAYVAILTANSGILTTSAYTGILTKSGTTESTVSTKTKPAELIVEEWTVTEPKPTELIAESLIGDADFFELPLQMDQLVYMVLQ